MPAAARSTVSRSTVVAAPAEVVWDLVSDLPGMGRLSPENTGGRWVRGEGPEVGAVFRGSNARGRRRWSTKVTVTRCARPRDFAFDVSALGLAVSRWSYVVEPADGGCTVTETWEDRRGSLLTRSGVLISGISDRAGFTEQSVEQTLARLKQVAEQQPAG